MSDKVTVFRVDRLDLAFKPKSWTFAVECRVEIDAYFADLRREKPAIWNGRVLLMYHQVVRDGVFSGDYLETDYASFSAWRAWGWPRAGVHDCFGAAAIIAADGGCLLGIMGPHTFSAGEIYFPCGTPDPEDIADGRVDLDFSVRREVKEETGIDAAEFTIEPGWTTVVEGALIVQIKLLRSSQPAETLRDRMRATLARERDPELSDICIVRSPRDFTPAMPSFVTAFLARYFAML